MENFLKNKKTRKITLVCLAILAVIGFCIVRNILMNTEKAKKSTQGLEISVELGKPIRKDIVPRFRFSGTLDPIWQADVAAKVDGRIEKIYTEEGTVVEAGESLCLLEQTDMSASLLAAKGAYLDAQTMYEKEKADYHRYQKLYEAEAISKEDYENSKFEMQNAEAKLEAARGNLEAAESNMGGTLVTTPRAGIIQKRYYQEGYYAKVGTALFNIADTSTLLAKISIPEGYIQSIQIGGKVEFIIPAIKTGDSKVEGVITRISPVAQLPSRTFEAEVKIDNSEGKLFGGLYAEATITASPTKNAITIPMTAMVMRDDQRTVYVVENGVAIRRVLTTGYIGDNEIEIISGISEEDIIVVGGHNKIREGSRIALPEKEGAK